MSLILPRFLTVFDTETTGLSKYDKIVSFGYAHIDLQEQTILDSGEMFADPRLGLKGIDYYRNGAYRITNIAVPKMPECNDPDKFHSQAELYKFVVQTFNTYGAILAHNIAFDKRMVNSLFAANKAAPLDNSGVKLHCSQKMLKKSNLHFDSYSLDNISKELKAGQDIDRTFHGARLDCLILADVLFKLRTLEYLKAEDVQNAS